MPETMLTNMQICTNLRYDLLSLRTSCICYKTFQPKNNIKKNLQEK